METPRMQTTEAHRDATTVPKTDADLAVEEQQSRTPHSQSSLPRSTGDTTLHKDESTDEDEQVLDPENDEQDAAADVDGRQGGDGRIGAGDGEKSDRSKRPDDDSRDGSHGGSITSWTSNEAPPLELNYEALKHVARYYLPGNHGECTEIETLERGSYHEIRILWFEDDWSCVGRFTWRKEENLSVLESEIANTTYVREHTTIPVPQTYYVNLDPTHPVGAPFVLMEHMEGHHLYKMWKALKTEYRISVLSQIAEVLAQLARLNGSLQNLTIPEHEPGRGPYDSLQDYARSFLREDTGRCDEVMALYPKVEEHPISFLNQQTGNSTLEAPYRLLHGDFDAQNMLFTWDSPDQTPKLSGIIDWDNSYTGPLYWLCEYPVFIRDIDHEEHLYEENKILRKRFVRMLADKFPAGSEDRRDIQECFRQKNRALNGFREIFTRIRWGQVRIELIAVGKYLEDLVQGGEAAYGGRPDYEPDSELGSDDGEGDDDQ
ncbi:hypothetical protein LTR85_012024 [Meristemomyces frigidus]|nr:hypothetical protein LTR85_012024 [Meristemomyces frigidus]